MLFNFNVPPELQSELALEVALATSFFLIVLCTIVASIVSIATFLHVEADPLGNQGHVQLDRQRSSAVPLRRHCGNSLLQRDGHATTQSETANKGTHFIFSSVAGAPAPILVASASDAPAGSEPDAESASWGDPVQPATMGLELLSHIDRALNGGEMHPDNASELLKSHGFDLDDFLECAKM